MFFRGNRIPLRVHPRYNHIPFRLLQHPAHNIHHGRLPRPIRSQQPVNPVPGYLKANISYSPLDAISM